jgi:FkbM family methyltransferase
MTRKRLIILVVITLVAAEVYLLNYTPRVLLGAMFLIGKSDCSFQETLAVDRWKLEYVDAEERMKRLSKLVRQDGGLQLWETPRGPFWMPEGSIPLIFGVLAEQEMKVYGSGESGVRQGDVVIDCGADVGTYTRFALERGASVVVAVEPASAKVVCLERTFSQEIAAGRVRVYPKGVWDRAESLTLDSAAVVSDHPMGGGEVVQLTTIDSLVDELKLARVDFIKMDIEGSEQRALLGARGTLTRFKPKLAISTEHSQGQAREVSRTVESIAPQYTITRGPCAYLDRRICPHVLFMH